MYNYFIYKYMHTHTVQVCPCVCFLFLRLARRMAAFCAVSACEWKRSAKNKLHIPAPIVGNDGTVCRFHWGIESFFLSFFVRHLWHQGPGGRRWFWEVWCGFSPRRRHLFDCRSLRFPKHSKAFKIQHNSLLCFFWIFSEVWAAHSCTVLSSKLRTWRNSLPRFKRHSSCIDGFLKDVLTVRKGPQESAACASWECRSD